jgi:hypothetical protein
MSASACYSHFTVLGVSRRSHEMSAMDALEGLLMAAVISSIAILASVLAPTVAFLAIALVSLRGTRPADRPAILRALAALPRRRDQRASRLPGVRSRRAIR